MMATVMPKAKTKACSAPRAIRTRPRKAERIARGALHAFVFAFGITVAINREGLLRTPGLSPGAAGWLALALVLLAVTWGASLRHLARERS